MGIPFAMAFFRRFFRQTAEPLPLPAYPDHMGAGCVFTDGKHILAGYQPHKKHPGITGIGGHKEGNETYLETAYRETLEELFHVSQIPVGLVEILVRTMRPRKFQMKKGYVLVFFNFEDLLQMLKLCKKSGLRSPLFSRWPKTLLELLQCRALDDKAEISILCLLPVVSHNAKTKDFVNPYFVQDLRDMI